MLLLPCPFYRWRKCGLGSFSNSSRVTQQKTRQAFYCGAYVLSSNCLALFLILGKFETVPGTQISRHQAGAGGRPPGEPGTCGHVELLDVPRAGGKAAAQILLPEETRPRGAHQEDAPVLASSRVCKPGLP